MLMGTSYLICWSQTLTMVHCTVTWVTGCLKILPVRAGWRRCLQGKVAGLLHFLIMITTETLTYLLPTEQQKNLYFNISFCSKMTAEAILLMPGKNWEIISM